MPRRLVYRPAARVELLQMFSDLTENFGRELALSAKHRLDAQMELLETNPFLGKAVGAEVFGERAVRKWVVHPRLVVYYSLSPEAVHILHLHDTRLPPPEDV